MKVIIRYIIFIFVATSVSCENSSPVSKVYNYGDSLNGSFEIADANGFPEKWMFKPSYNAIALIDDATAAYDGSMYLRFKPFKVLNSAIECAGALNSAFVKESLEITLNYRVIDGENLTFGLLYQSISDGVPGNQMDIPIIENNSHMEQWTSFKFTVPIEDIGELFIYGFWVKGTGEVWLDSWNMFVDGNEYDVAVAKSIPSLSEKEIKALEQLSIPITLTQKEFERTKSMPWLESAVGSATIVLLGESTHGTQEFIKARERITDYLVSNLGFTTVVLEANLPEVDVVYNKLLDGAADESIKESLKGLRFFTVQNREFLEFLHTFKYLKSNNGDNALLTGCDMQFYETSLRKIMQFADEHNDLILKSSCLELLSEPSDRLSASKNFHNLRSQILHYKLVANATTTQPQYDYDYLLQLVNIASDAMVLEFDNPPMSFRDSAMAKNVMWHLEQKKNKKIVVWAHNEHITYQDSAIGFWLDKKLGSDYVRSFGFATGEGTYLGIERTTQALAVANLTSPVKESWEYDLHRIGERELYLPISDEFPFHKFHKRLLRYVGAGITPVQFLENGIGERFDGLIYIDSTHAISLY